MRAVPTLSAVLILIAGCSDAPLPTESAERFEPPPTSRYSAEDEWRWAAVYFSATHGYWSAIMHDAVVTAGYYTRSAQLEGSISEASSAGNWTIWSADTIFRARLDRLRWGSSAPGCVFSGESTTVGRNVSTMNGSCPAAWLEVSYWLDKEFVYTPLDGYVAGPFETSQGHATTFTAVPTGGMPWYAATWSVSTERGGAWTALSQCGTAMTCSYTPATAGVLYVRAVITGRYRAAPDAHSTRWHLDAESVTRSSSVSVAATAPPPQPMSASVTGPSAIYPNTTYTWNVSQSGGYSPFTYQWYVDGVPAGNLASLSKSFPPESTHWLSVRVTDAWGYHVESEQFYVIVNTGSCLPGQSGCAEMGIVPD